ncbi:hypothetical protein MMC29_004578 [Sticta canariensis]|nr:hypothetical protein [Sticta canariensis]
MESLGQHVLHDHIEPQGTFNCPIDQCAEKLDMYQAPSHLMLEHDPDSYVCLWQNCGQTFPDSKELDRHIKANHAIWDCHWAGCEVSAREVSQLKNHVDIDHLHFSGFSQPSMSPYALQTPMYAGQHPAIQNSTQSPFTTPQLSPTNPVAKPFVQGSMVSGNKNPLGVSEGGSRCMWLTDESSGQVCGKTFSDGNELQLHVDQEHVWTREGNTTGVVLLCHWLDCKRNGKPLQNKEKLRRHLFTHTGYWIACCSFCSKQFNNTVALENHERVHTGEKPFACKDCEQCFATDAALTIHKRHHTGEKPLSCPVCGYASADSSNMAKHKKSLTPLLTLIVWAEANILQRTNHMSTFAQSATEASADLEVVTAPDEDGLDEDGSDEDGPNEDGLDEDRPDENGPDENSSLGMIDPGHDSSEKRDSQERRLLLMDSNV